MGKNKTILCCNQKGGVGKTLVSDELSFAFDLKCFFGTFFAVATAEGVSEGGPTGKQE